MVLGCLPLPPHSWVLQPLAPQVLFPPAYFLPALFQFDHPKLKVRLGGLLIGLYSKLRVMFLKAGLVSKFWNFKSKKRS